MNVKKYGRVVLGVIGIIVLAFLLIHKNTPTQQEQTHNEKLQVVASFYPVYFFAQQIGGDHANVTNVTPAGAEPHDYEPNPQDIARIEDSRLLVLNGGEVDVWGDRVKQNIDSSKTAVVVAGEGLMTRQIEDEEDQSEMIADPHVWLSPTIAEKMVDKITAGFVAADPSNASDYQLNATALKAKLTDLDTEYRQGLASCQSKDIITSHAAFGYLAQAYGLNQVPISGISPDEEPSAQDLVNVAKFAEENNVQYIFFEELVSPKLSETVANEIGAQTLVLNPLEGLAQDELDEGKNYFTEMQDNLTNLRIALSCE